MKLNIHNLKYFLIIFITLLFYFRFLILNNFEYYLYYYIFLSISLLLFAINLNIILNLIKKNYILFIIYTYLFLASLMLKKNSFNEFLTIFFFETIILFFPIITISIIQSFLKKASALRIRYLFFFVFLLFYIFIISILIQYHVSQNLFNLLNQEIFFHINTNSNVEKRSISINGNIQNTGYLIAFFLFYFLSNYRFNLFYNFNLIMLFYSTYISQSKIIGLVLILTCFLRNISLKIKIILILFTIFFYSKMNRFKSLSFEDVILNNSFYFWLKNINEEFNFNYFIGSGIGSLSRSYANFSNNDFFLSQESYWLKIIFENGILPGLLFIFFYLKLLKFFLKPYSLNIFYLIIITNFFVPTFYSLTISYLVLFVSLIHNLYLIKYNEK